MYERSTAVLRAVLSHLQHPLLSSSRCRGLQGLTSEGQPEMPCSFGTPMDDCYSLVHPSQDQGFKLP